MPRVSVVIPAYNNAQFIAKTVESVLSQTYRDFELIISDHSSTDGTRTVLAPFAQEARVRIVSIDSGGGAERNWNHVTGLASGDLLKLVCGDDLLYPDALEQQVRALDDAGAGCHMAASSRDLIDAEGRLVIRDLGLGGLRGHVDGPSAVRRSVRLGANIFGEPCCALFRRNALADVGNWHDRVGYHIDQSTYSRVLLRGDLAAVPGPQAAFRLSSAQWSVALAKEQARSAALLHRELRGAAPTVISAGDVRIGDAMARLRAVQRRLVYLYLGRRMSAGHSDERTA